MVFHGGCDMETERVELLIDGKVVEKATGKCKETMKFQEWSLSCFLGKDAQIRFWLDQVHLKMMGKTTYIAVYHLRIGDISCCGDG